MTTYTNSLEGGSNGTTISSGNSGSTSGDAFTSIFGGGGLTFSNTQAMHGSLSARSTNSSSSPGAAQWTISGTAAAARMYVYVTSVPSADEHLIRFLTGATRLASLHINSAGKLRLSDASGTTGVWTAAATFPLNQWVRIELFAVSGSSTSNGTLKVGTYLGDSTTPIETVYSSTTANVGAAQTFSSALLGKVSGATAAYFYFDDLAVNDAATDLIGPVTTPPTSPVYPSAVDSNTGTWTNQGGAASLNAAVADASDTTYIRSAGAGTNEPIVFSINPLSTGNVTINYRARLQSGSTATQVKVELLEGATVRATRTQTLTTSFAAYSIDLDSSENSAIVDRTNLKIRLTGNPT